METTGPDLATTELGVFLIPPPEHPVYRIASGILGYDIWARRRTRSSLADDLGEDALRSWLGRAPTFGFHCTVAGADIAYDLADVEEITTRLAWIASRVPPFTVVHGRYDDAFHANPHVLVTTFDVPDGALDRLHRLVTTIVSPLHVASGCARPRDPADERGWEIFRRTGEAWALERFVPHWSLLTYLPDAAARARVREVITRRTGLFADERTRTLPVTDVHLVQRGVDGYYTVAASFPLTGR